MRDGYDAALQKLNAYFDAMDKWMALLPYAAEGQAPRAKAEAVVQGSPLVRAMIPALDRLRELNARCEGERRATRLVAHLMVHRKEHDSFPVSLDEMKVDNLAGIRIDPFSGKDFIYKKQGDNFLLYSISENMRDDGGQHDSKANEGDDIYWPVPD